MKSSKPFSCGRTVAEMMVMLIDSVTKLMMTKVLKVKTTENFFSLCILSVHLKFKRKGSKCILYNFFLHFCL